MSLFSLTEKGALQMIAPLDVFAVIDEQPQWLGFAETLVRALEIARERGTGSYLVFSQTTGHKSFYEVDAAGNVSPVEASLAKRSS